jgi:hypothetical protein
MSAPHSAPRSRRARPVAGAVVLMALAAATAAALPTRLAEGLTFRYTVTSASTDKGRRAATNVHAMVRVQDGHIRMDHDDGKGPSWQGGGWLLVRGDARQFVMVNDRDRRAMVMDAATFGSGAGAMLNNRMVKVTMSDVGFSHQDLGPGEPMLGYPTRHVRVVNRSTVEMKVLLVTRRTTTIDTTEQWVASGIPMDGGSLLAWARAFGAGVQSTNAELGEAIGKYTDDYGRTGMVLRSVTYSTMIDQRGRVTRDTVTMQVTDIRKGALDAEIFRIPAGYEVVEFSSER